MRPFIEGQVHKTAKTGVCFSGFFYQATVAGGYGRRLLKSDRFTWDAEVGPGARIS
ncbi:MAG: putative salt-induced outer membrane protein YdiY [Paracoccaceae bacterium]|jgi:putative salt-induced outer membrane protein YdiY